jgi:hypothetical protein
VDLAESGVIADAAFLLLRYGNNFLWEKEMTAHEGETLVWLFLGLAILLALGAMWLTVKLAYHRPFIFLLLLIILAVILFYLFGLNS